MSKPSFVLEPMEALYAGSGQVFGGELKGSCEMSLESVGILIELCVVRLPGGLEDTLLQTSWEKPMAVLTSCTPRRLLNAQSKYLIETVCKEGTFHCWRGGKGQNLTLDDVQIRLDFTSLNFEHFHMASVCNT